MGEIIQDKKTIPNAVKKIEHIMKHSIPPPSDKALIIFSWSVFNRLLILVLISILVWLGFSILCQARVQTWTMWNLRTTFSVPDTHDDSDYLRLKVFEHGEAIMPTIMPDLIQPVADALGLIAMSIVTKYLLLHLRLIDKPQSRMFFNKVHFKNFYW